LKDRGYRGVTFSEAAGGGDDRAVGITFDDGYRSVLDLALPILQEARFRATVFAPSAWIGSEEPMSWDGISEWVETTHRDELLPMSWEQLDELRAEGWEVGSHTRSHPRLSNIGDEELVAELEGSRADITARFGDCQALAYPYGDYDGRVMKAAEAAGYRFAGTLWGSRPSGGDFDLPRAGIYHGDSTARFKLKLSRPVRLVRGSVLWESVSGSRTGRPAI
jgi:peptidoglycan/xylan/chitin deacetylase (PgdA/CDA1 family)